MIGVDIAEVQRAAGYAGAGALALKMLDVLVKWRSGQRNDALAELSEARQLSRDMREELRRTLEETRIELAATEVQLEESETERLKLKRQLATAEEALASARKAGERQDEENLRHVQETDRERERRPHSRLKP